MEEGGLSRVENHQGRMVEGDCGMKSEVIPIANITKYHFALMG